MLSGSSRVQAYTSCFHISCVALLSHEDNYLFVTCNSWGSPSVLVCRLLSTVSLGPPRATEIQVVNKNMVDRKLLIQVRKQKGSF